MQRRAHSGVTATLHRSSRVGMHEYYNAAVQSLKSTTRQVPNASKICGRINKDRSTRWLPEAQRPVAEKK